MSHKNNFNKNHWNDSMHIFFSPKLSLEGKNLLPQIIDPGLGHRQQNFLTVFKKPIINVYDKINVKKQKKPAVLVVGQSKQVQKRNQTAENKRRHISAELQEQFIKNYRDTINQVYQLHKPYRPKGLSYNKIDFTKQKQEKQKYYFYIGPGNNAQLVEQILNKRCNWVQTTSSLYHLRWEQARPKYQNSAINKQLINHLPNHQVISDKVGLVNSLKSYCEKNQQQIFSIIPACFYFDFGNLESCENEIKRFIEFYYQEAQRINKLQLYQDQKNTKASSFTNSPKKNTKTESSKATLNNNLSKNISIRSSTKKTNFSIGECNKRKQQIKQLHRTLLTKLKTHYNFVDMSVPRKQSPFLAPIHFDVFGNTCLWLLKPADLNRGRGTWRFIKTITRKALKRKLFGTKVYIKTNVDKLQKVRYKSIFANNPKQIRYIRTSSVTFDVSSKNYFTHLTNNAIQKYSKTYGQFQEGNILPLNFLFKECGMDKKQLYDEIKKKITICSKASFSKIFNYVQKLPNVTSSQPINQHQNTSNLNKIKYFQIFGYDFMVDQTGHIWLIEVNTNPCIQLSNQWLKLIIPRMLDDAFKLTVDKIFPRGKQLKQNPQVQNFYHVPQYADQQIMWQYLQLKSQAQLNPSQIIN